MQLLALASFRLRALGFQTWLDFHLEPALVTSFGIRRLMPRLHYSSLQRLLTIFSHENSLSPERVLESQDFKLAALARAFGLL